jgi:hypothetical protein
VAARRESCGVRRTLRTAAYGGRRAGVQFRQPVLPRQQLAQATIPFGSAAGARAVPAFLSVER